MHFGGRNEDFSDVENAIRDILFLYRDLTDYHGFSGDHDVGSFEPWRFLDCSVSSGYGGAETARLLHEGAAVALLSEMVDRWEQNGGWDFSRHRAAVEQGRFDHLATARSAVIGGLESEDAMWAHLGAVYEEYVLAYFAALSHARAADASN